MEFLLSLPTWSLALVIFCLRIVDVSLGTFRTLTVVQGRVRLSVLLGFFEVLIWITAISPLFVGITASPALLIAYAAGFAAGNATGILLERRMALGSVVVQILTAMGSSVAERLRPLGHNLGVFPGEAGSAGGSTLIVATCLRRDVGAMVDAALARDPGLFYTVSPVRDYTQRLTQPLPHATGWRAVFKRK